MKDFKAINPNAVVNFHFPTSFDEIDAEYLKAITANIHVADHHTLIGIVYHEKIFNVITSVKRNAKSMTSAVTPIFIRSGNTDSDFIASATCKDKLIIPSTSLSLAYHAAAPRNVLSLDYFLRAISGDTEIFKRYDGNYGNEECFFVEFKIVPNCEIKGFYTKAEQIDSTKYVEIQKEVVGDC